MERTINIALPNDMDSSELFGNIDSNINLIKETLDVDIVQRGNELIVKGEDAEGAKDILKELVAMFSKGESLDLQKVGYVISLVERGMSYSNSDVEKDIICYTH